MDLQHGVYFALGALVLVSGLVKCQTCSNGLCRKRDITRLGEEITEVKNEISRFSGEMSKVLDQLVQMDTRLNNIAAMFESTTNVLKKGSAVFESTTDVPKTGSAKYGEASVSAGITCLDIQKKRLPEKLPSGLYWVTLGNRKAQQLYCDMDTDDGGWSLVWTYTFTNYANFNSDSNAVTPRPSWDDTGYTKANTPASTSPPLSETQLGALEFAKWKQIGREFMIKSNINQWIACTPNIGSFVDWENGSLNCRVVKVVATKCTDVVPTRISFWRPKGPVLRASDVFYFFDTNKGSNWPAHDPCGVYGENHINDVANPRGNVFIR
ncbi:unnamed protein product [Owenia fusiformis]|uniref:Fibrinogen C-terminal domain-containing protein n=1 Tax=Owenia fusiformis TaxID=6347 RepID=A0A8S4NNY4_OWEFU|nr:unnamed protein product [Owenia fusiformis]